MSKQTIAKPRQIAISVLADVVTIELICGDEYEAQVTADDIIERLQAGEGLTLSVKLNEPTT